MLAPTQLLRDPDFREFHLRDLQRGRACGVGPVVAQVVGNNPEEVVRGAREVVPWVDGIGEHDLSSLCA
jgi:tRNA-dihydrouridine synthase 1